MRFKNLMIGMGIGASCVTAATALAPNGSMPDIARTHYERQNCHGAYDVLAEDLGAGKSVSSADTAWAQSYEANAAAGQPCPAPSEALARRASNRIVVTDLGLGKVATYRDKVKDPTASFELAYAVLTDKTKKLSPQEGFALLNEAVERGDAAAQFFLASLHIAGILGKPSDYASGFPLVQKAAASNHVDALFMLANMYSAGLGTKKDPKLAFDYYRQAAERGHVYAAYLAAYMANSGEGAKKDHVLAYRLARNLAEQGEVVGAVLAASALLQQKNSKQLRESENEVLYWMDVAIRDGDAKIKGEIAKFRPQVVAAYKRFNAPPEYKPRVWKACPMKTVCYVNHYSGLRSCTTNKDYWNDCDG